MLRCSECIESYEEIRNYVTKILGGIELLKSDCCQLSVRLLHRGSQPCGVYFCLHGPRAVRLSAIWETDSNTILFYGTRGERVQRTQIIGAPELPRSKSAG